jgi:hypothetical protein
VSNMLFMFQCGMIVVYGHLKTQIMDGCTVARIYLTTWRFVVDVLSVAPFIYLVRLCATHGALQMLYTTMFYLVLLCCHTVVVARL